MKPDHRSDDELLLAARQDPEAFGEFYERHSQEILRFLRRATGDTEQALDLTAEVFAAALAATARYRPGEAPAGAWLVGIARKKLAASRKRSALDQAARRRLGIPALHFSDEALERVDELLALAGETYTQGMTDLSVEENEAVTARVIDEREYADIASAAGTTEAAIRKRVSRGLAKLASLGGRANE